MTERTAGGPSEPRRVIGSAARAVVIIALSICICTGPIAGPACAAISTSHASSTERAASAEGSGNSLEAAAAKAGDTGRAVAMSLIGLAFAVAATVLAFRRDFKEAAGVFAVGIVSVLLATPTGIELLRATVNSLFGAQ